MLLEYSLRAALESIPTGPAAGSHSTVRFVYDDQAIIASPLVKNAIESARNALASWITKYGARCEPQGNNGSCTGSNHQVSLCTFSAWEQRKCTSVCERNNVILVDLKINGEYLQESPSGTVYGYDQDMMALPPAPAGSQYVSPRSTQTSPEARFNAAAARCNFYRECDIFSSTGCGALYCGEQQLVSDPDKTDSSECRENLGISAAHVVCQDAIGGDHPRLTLRPIHSDRGTGFPRGGSMCSPQFCENQMRFSR